jgi:hypothetical protein
MKLLVVFVVRRTGTGIDTGFSSLGLGPHGIMARPQCRILYSTQSGRAKACARRTARILGLVRASNSFDEDIIGTDTLQEYVRQQLRPESQTTTTTLILFVSTTGDGEHTVRRHSLRSNGFRV